MQHNEGTTVQIITRESVGWAPEHVEQQLRQPGALLGAALYYATKGVPVLPLTARNKITRRGIGVYDATTDTETVRQWWTQWPDANIGIACGHGFDVIDVDGLEGWQSLGNILEPDTGEQIPTIARAFTGGGGLHLYVVPSQSWSNAVKKLPGIDYRTKGGYVVAPPSIHETGRLYWWQQPLKELPQ